MDRYKPVCPFCGTWVLGTKAGYFTSVSDAARALNAHMRFNCADAPVMSARVRDSLANAHITVVEESDAARSR